MASESQPPEIPGRSFLTKSQRNYLHTGGEGLNAPQKRNLRYQIRKNIQSTLMDFQFIANIKEKDKFKAAAPLSVFYGRDKLADWVQENESEKFEELYKIDLGDDEVEQYQWTGQMMHEGLQDLLALYISLYGPERFEELVQHSLDQATVHEAVERMEQIGIYNVNFDHFQSIPEGFQERLE